MIRKAHEAVSTRYGFPQPRVIEMFERAGVLIRDVERAWTTLTPAECWNCGRTLAIN